MDAGKPVLLITGASSGIGAATARAAAETHRLVLAARRLEPMQELAAELGGDDSALAVACDVAEWDQVEAMRDEALAAFGRIDAVFANAGFGAARGFLEETPEHWRSMILTNVYGVALTIRAALPHLLERGDGHVLITSSVAGRRARPGSLYSATKWAATAIGEALRAELRQEHDNHGIRVTLIEPGFVRSGFQQAAGYDPAWFAAVAEDNGPLLEPDDVAAVVEFVVGRPAHVHLDDIRLRPTRQQA